MEVKLNGLKWNWKKRIWCAGDIVLDTRAEDWLMERKRINDKYNRDNRQEIDRFYSSETVRNGVEHALGNPEELYNNIEGMIERENWQGETKRFVYWRNQERYAEAGSYEELKQIASSALIGKGGGMRKRTNLTYFIFLVSMLI